MSRFRKGVPEHGEYPPLRRWRFELTLSAANFRSTRLLTSLLAERLTHPTASARGGQGLSWRMRRIPAWLAVGVFAATLIGALVDLLW